jgi:hypothetical protein
MRHETTGGKEFLEELHSVLPARIPSLYTRVITRRLTEAYVQDENSS